MEDAAAGEVADRLCVVEAPYLPLVGNSLSKLHRYRTFSGELLN